MLTESICRERQLPSIEDPEGYILKESGFFELPGIDVSGVQLEAIKATAKATPATNEKTQAEPATVTEPARQPEEQLQADKGGIYPRFEQGKTGGLVITTEGEKLLRELFSNEPPPIENVPNDFVYMGKEVGRMSTQSTIDAETLTHQEEVLDSYKKELGEPGLNSELELSVPTGEAAKQEFDQALVQATQAAIEELETASMVKHITSPVEPAAAEPAPTRAPWDIPMLAEEELANSEEYKESLKADPLLAMAMRVVCMAFPKELWWSPRMLEEVSKVLNIFKNWEAKHGKAN